MHRSVNLPPPAVISQDGSVAGGWWTEADDNRIVCELCPRECHLKPGDRGFCFVRENQAGEMRLTTYGRSTGFCIDPIEKKPLNHFYPGTSVLSFGTAGCNLGCKFCQNWSISKSREVAKLSQHATPTTIADAAQQLGCRSVAFTYNDPIIWAEYAIDTAKACRERGVKTVAVTAGYITEQAREPFFAAIDAANVDLKAFTEEFYQQLTLSHLQPILDTLRWIKHESNVWLEITNLVIPRANDSDSELKRMCDWVLDAVGDEVPIHFSAFHPDFRMQDRERTPLETLLRGYRTAKSAGIKHAYVGNVNDVRHQSTYCSNCQELVIERNWYALGQYHLHGNQCSHCRQTLAGHFESQPGNWGRKRQPINIAEFAKPDRVTGQLSSQSLPIIQTGDSVMNSSASVANADPGRPQLTSEQELATLTATSELVQAAVLNLQPQLSDPTLAGAAEVAVFGCFTSIKRKGRLRGCCGFLGRRTSLLEAIEHSAKISATGDVRMPSVTADELAHLDFEVWLLYGQKAVAERGEARIDAVEIGVHGLQIQRDNARGLLLPGVATDLNLDSEGFLNQVCIKAGLSPHDWKSDDTRLASFKGVVVKGQFDSNVLIPADEAARLFSSDEIDQLAAFSRENVFAIARGATPNYFLNGCSDGQVHGTSVTIQVAGRPEPIHVAKMVMRNAMPLQTTLFQISEQIGNAIRSENRTLTHIDQLQIQIAVLYKPAMHGTVAAPDLDGFDPKRRALIVTQGNQSAWIYNPEQTAEAILAQAADDAQITVPEASSVYSLIAQTNETPWTVTNVPKPQPGSTVREPAVAGRFYPASEQELTQLMNELTPQESVETEAWRAALIPHAGLIYSGGLAIDVLRRCNIPRRVIVIGPKHTRFGCDWAVAPHESWKIPGAIIRGDVDLAQQLCDEISSLQLDAAAHQAEHAIEVELPWLARLAPDSQVVGIAIGSGNLDRCHAFAEGLAKVIGSTIDETLLVISSDMNHFATDTETRRVDKLAIDEMLKLDADALLETVRNNKISMCGVLPAVMVLDTLKRLDLLTEAQQVGYDTSARVTGDTSRVVGYAGMLFR